MNYKCLLIILWEFIFREQLARLNCNTLEHIKQKAFTLQQLVKQVEFIDVIQSRAQYWQACQYMDSLAFSQMSFQLDVITF